jgi:hypothetical protein
MRTVATLALGAALGVVLPTGAAEWYVGPAGSASGRGTRESPWDVESALAGRHRVAPGDTLFLLGGTYRRRPAEQYEVRLVGAEGLPVRVRPAPGARARIDGGLTVLEPSAHLWIEGLELFVSEPQPDRPAGPGSFPADFKRPWGGLNVHGGGHCKFLNLVIHDCRQGVSWWSGSHDSELYGCLIYDNGWPATDRGHGHAIYTQNNEGTKVIADCILTGGHGFSLHAYGSSRADVNNYQVEGNVCYHAGTFLIGGGRPSKHIRVRTNYLHGVSVQIGYAAPTNEDCDVRENVLVDGGLTIQRYQKVVNEGNRILARGAPRPPGALVVVRPNRYDPGRAHVAIYNWDHKPAVAVDPKGFLKAGDSYRLLDPRHFFGKPVAEGVYHGGPIPAPVAGEFAAFVLVKAAARPG